MSSVVATKSPCRVKLDHLETKQRCHFRSEAEALSRELNMRLYRTSVKDDLNVSVVFQHLAENYVNKVSYTHPVIIFYDSFPLVIQ